MDIDQLTDVSSTGLSCVPTLKELSQDLMMPVQAEAPAARLFLPLGRITTTARRGYRAPTLTPSLHAMFPHNATSHRLHPLQLLKLLRS